MKFTRTVKTTVVQVATVNADATEIVIVPVIVEGEATEKDIAKAMKKQGIAGVVRETTVNELKYEMSLETFLKYATVVNTGEATETK